MAVRFSAAWHASIALTYAYTSTYKYARFTRIPMLRYIQKPHIKLIYLSCCACICNKAHSQCRACIKRCYAHPCSKISNTALQQFVNLPCTVWISKFTITFCHITRFTFRIQLCKAQIIIAYEYGFSPHQLAYVCLSPLLLTKNAMHIENFRHIVEHRPWWCRRSSAAFVRQLGISHTAHILPAFLVPAAPSHTCSRRAHTITFASSHCTIHHVIMYNPVHKNTRIAHLVPSSLSPCAVNQTARSPNIAVVHL